MFKKSQAHAEKNNSNDSSSLQLAMPITGIMGKQIAPSAAQPLFRGDSRPIEQIHTEGFKPKGSNLNLYHHSLPFNAEGNVMASGYVATSSSKSIASEFPIEAFKTKRVYEILSDKTPVNVLEELTPLLLNGEISSDDFSMVRAEKEKAFPGAIEPHEIKGCWQTDASKETFTPNPNYKVPSSILAQNFLNVMRPTAHALTGLGLALDGLSLHTEYQLSTETGEYSNTYREGARIAGGWAGASTGGFLVPKQVLLPVHRFHRLLLLYVVLEEAWLVE